MNAELHFKDKNGDVTTVYPVTSAENVSGLSAALAGKVDKENGKGLSSNDYTTTEKEKLADIEAGANAYTLPAATSSALGGVKQGANITIAADGTISAANYTLPKATTTSLGGIQVGSDLNIDSSTGALSVDKTSNVTSDSNKPVTSEGVYAALENKVDKVPGKGLSSNDYTDNDKNKLSGIEAGAEVNVQADWNQTSSTADDYIKNKPTLGTAAAASASDFATAAQGTKADNAIPSSAKGTANGVAELDSNGLVPASQLPSFVDDVLEYASASGFPVPGESGKIYVAKDTNLSYRWSGSAYVEISPSLALGTTESTAYRGDRGQTAYEHATDSSRLTTAKTSGLYKIAATAEGHVASATPVTKSDITVLGIPAQDTTYSDATTTVSGLMSAADKTKLDRFSEYAEHSATYNNNKIAINGYEHISKNAYGSKSNATGLSVMVNSSGEPEVMNTDTEGLSKYHDRDVVGAYISADGVDPLYNIPMNRVTYRSDGCVVDYDMPNLLPDMIIDTSDNNYVGVVETYDRATGTITLADGWWHKRDHVKGTPVGTGFWVQKTTKVWGINVNVGLPSGIKTNAAAIEAGLYNNGSTGQDRGVFDAVLLKGDGDYGVRSRGAFYYGYLAQGSTVGYAYRPESKTNLALSVELGGNEWFVVRSDGLINRTVKSVAEKGTAQLAMGDNVIIEAGDNATLTLPQSAPKGTIIEVFIASSNHITFAAPNSETVWYQGGTAASASFTGVYNSLFRIIKYSDTQWLIFIQHMAKLNEVDFTSAEYDNVITTYNTVGTRVKNLCPINAATIPQGGGYIIDTDVCITKGSYYISWNGTATSGQSEIKFKNGNTEVASLTVNNATSNKHYVVAPDDVTHITMFCNVENSISNVMIRDARTSEDYEPYAPNLQAQIKALEERITALES